MTIRLPWQRNPAGGFIAYPEGEHRKDRSAELTKHSTGGYSWRWVVHAGAARTGGDAPTQQEGADAAAAVWPAIVAEAERLNTVAAEAERLRTMVQRMCQKGDLSLEVFGIEESATDRLTTIIGLVKDAGGLNGPAKPLVEACSAELFRRRTGQTNDGPKDV
jgi:hypothetical protein